MSDLLDSVIAADSGWDRWTKVKSITVDASITGALWDCASWCPPNDARFGVDSTRAFLRLDFIGKDKRSVFEPHRVFIEHNDGALIDGRDDERSRLTDITSRHRRRPGNAPLPVIRNHD
jgi:hypothetical protein